MPSRRTPYPAQSAVRGSSLTVAEVIRYLIPHGTSKGRWDKFPIWPPDTFAVAAYLVDRSGCYATLRPDTIGARIGGPANVQHLRHIGMAWRFGTFLFSRGRRRTLRDTLPPTVDKDAVLKIEEDEVQRRWFRL